MDKDGVVKLSDKIPGVSGINAAINDAVQNDSRYSSSFFTANNLFPSNYNCFESAIKISEGGVPDFGTVLPSSKFIKEVNSKYNNVDQANATFGRTIITFGNKDFFNLGDPHTEHAALYLGQSKDGTIYTWSKNGQYYPPGISTLNSLTNYFSGYDPVRGVDGTKDKGYYNLK